MVVTHMLDTHTRPIIATVLGHTEEGAPSGTPRPPPYRTLVNGLVRFADNLRVKIFPGLIRDRMLQG